MEFYDIFNGDADGLCALHQLRLAEPRDATLVTGVKRDIALLKGLTAGPGDELTVLDVSLNENRADLQRLLAAGARCLYFDHHFPGEIPRHPGLRAFIDTSPQVCTSLLVDSYLQGAQRIWAVAAAFGDNLEESARRAAQPLGLTPDQLDQLRELGQCLNYNAYGETVEDLYYHPAELYRRVSRFRDPFAFMAEDPAFEVLKRGYAEDMTQALALSPQSATQRTALYILPDAAWARRISGVFSNHLARSHPQRAHAVLVPKRAGGYSVSVRSPLSHPAGADALARRFPTGGGRAAAAGINHLPEEQLADFAREFAAAF